MKKGGGPELKRRCGRKVLDILKWLQSSWHNVHDCDSMAWLNYDTLYRKHTALKKDTKWSMTNTTTYPRCITGAGVCA